MQNGAVSLEIVSKLFFKTKHTLTTLFAIPFLGTYPEKFKTYSHTHTQNICTRKTDKDWKYPRCLSISEWNIVIQQQEEMRCSQATKRNGGH